VAGNDFCHSLKCGFFYAALTLIVFVTLQSRYMHFWFNQSGMPGRITRLLTVMGADHLGTSNLKMVFAICIIFKKPKTLT
jgi:hypothetical protein